MPGWLSSCIFPMVEQKETEWAAPCGEGRAGESGSDREACPSVGPKEERGKAAGGRSGGRRSPGERGAAVGEGSTAGGGKRKKRSDASLSG